MGGALPPLPLRALIAYTETNLISKPIHPPTILRNKSKVLNKNVKCIAPVQTFCAMYPSRSLHRSSTDVAETAVHYTPYINILLNVEEHFIVNNPDPLFPEPRCPTARMARKQ